jgi:ribosome maturation protein SDO1
MEKIIIKMNNTLARIKKAGKNFEIMVDLDSALAFRKGESDFIEAESSRIFTDAKKGNVAPTKDLQEAFKTTDVNEIVKKIVKEGEVQLNQEYRDEAREMKIKQVVDFLASNAIDPQTKRPHTPERIRSALINSGIHIKDGPIDKQIKEIIEEVSKILPIKIETKKVKINIPAINTGRAYGVVSHYIEQEKWLDNGDLEIIVKIPSGVIIDFYEKLNGVTHGSALTEEVKE